MSLSQAITDLAVRVGQEVSARIEAEHPGLSHAWGVVRVAGDRAVCPAAFNAALARIGRGRFRIRFTLPLADADYCILTRCDSPWPVRLQIGEQTPAGFMLDFSLLGFPVDPDQFDFVVYR